MKKIKIIGILIIIAALVCALASCSGGGVDKKGTATILVDNGDGAYTSYTVNLSKVEGDEGALSLLEYLSTQKGTTLRYTTQSGAYGAYMTSINELNPDPLSEYISVYTNEEADFPVSTDGMAMPGIKYEDTELKYSGVGISEMTVKDGTVIMFRLESFA